MHYQQITPGERYTLALLRKQGSSNAEIARITGRHRSTIGREFRRNLTAYDGAYRPAKAQEHANARRWTPRRNSRFGPTEWAMVEALLREKFSPEQISGWLRRCGALEISHETIYLYVWRNKKRGGQLWRHLRQPLKRRKRYNTYEKRGRVAGKRHISERSAIVETRSEIGHWEMDTVLGTGDNHCVVSLVERAAGAVLIGKLRRRNVAALNKRLIELITVHPRLFKTITADNGTEFHGFADVGHRCSHLLRHTVPLVGAGYERKHQWTHSPVPAKANIDEAHHSGTMQCHRELAKQSAAETLRLPHSARAIGRTVHPPLTRSTPE